MSATRCALWRCVAKRATTVLPACIDSRSLSDKTETPSSCRAPVFTMLGSRSACTPTKS